MNFEPTIKLEVEIKEGKFIWSYNIGGSTHNSTSHMTPDNLAAFVYLLKHCQQVSWPKNKDEV